MQWRSLMGAGLVILCLSITGAAGSAAMAQSGKNRSDGWTLPPGAEQETNPVQGTPQALVAGRALFQKNCRRCHGPAGKGDGPDADPDRAERMDLTNPARASANPDGVVFHKIWNGRQGPKMPAFGGELTREQIWTIVTYVQTLRKPSSP